MTALVIVVFIVTVVMEILSPPAVAAIPPTIAKASRYQNRATIARRIWLYIGQARILR